jgi:hypothetical protein
MSTSKQKKQLSTMRIVPQCLTMSQLKQEYHYSVARLYYLYSYWLFLSQEFQKNAANKTPNIFFYTSYFNSLSVMLFRNQFNKVSILAARAL